MQEPATAFSTEPPKANVRGRPEAGASRSAHMPCILTDVTTFGLRPSPQPFGRRPPASGLRLPAPTSGMSLWFMGEQEKGHDRQKHRAERKVQEEATDLLSSNCRTKSKCEANAKTQRAKDQRRG